MAVLTVIRLPYHLGRLTLFAFGILPYFQWKTWRAKSAFKNELLKNGVPGQLAADLTDIYGDASKLVLRQVFTL